MFQLEIRKNAIKFLKSRSEKDKGRVFKALDKLAVNPLDKTLDIKPLVNCHYLRLRVNNYRIIYEVLESKFIKNINFRSYLKVLIIIKRQMQIILNKQNDLFTQFPCR